MNENRFLKVIRNYFWYIPAVIWMVVIFRMSGQVGKISSGLSFRVTKKIVSVIEIVRGGDAQDEMILVLKLHPYIRKLAHMTEYGILYMLLFLSFMASFRAVKSMALAILASFIYACTDEFHQTMVLERSGQFTDVCIDMTGVLATVFLTLIIYSAWQGRRERRT